MKYLSHFLAIVLGLLCATDSLLAQEPVWLNHYANGGSNDGFRLASDGQAGLYGIGTLHGGATFDDTTIAVLGSSDILIARWDTSGNLIWARTAGGSCQPGDTDSGGGIHYEGVNDLLIATGLFSCAPTYFGSQILNGSGPLSGIRSMFISAYSPEGDCVWARKITASPQLTFGFSPVISDSDGSVFLFGSGGSSAITFHGTTSITIPSGGFVSKYSSDGSIVSAERILENGIIRNASWAGPNQWHLSGSVKPGAALWGQSIPVSNPNGDGFAALADTTGAVSWITRFPASSSSEVLRTAFLPNGSCLVSGLFTGDLLLPGETLVGTPSMTNSFVAHLSAQGEILWALPFTSNGNALLTDLEVDPYGDVLVFGRFEGELQIGQSAIAPSASKSGLLCRMGSDGVLEAAMSYGRVPGGTGSVLSTSQGNYLSAVFDSTISFGSSTIEGATDEFARDLFLARFDSLSGFTNVPSTMATEGGALVIYANPNEGRATVELPKGLAPGSTVRLLVRDAQGQLVQEEAFAVSARGTVQLDISAQAKGVYHVELLDKRRRFTGKVVFE